MRVCFRTQDGLLWVNGLDANEKSRILHKMCDSVGFRCMKVHFGRWMFERVLANLVK